ncbi:MAG: HIT domain-containing protein [Caulobacter sp.]|nr:HIT domain-containing protein [Caulobacter sp.]
MAEFQPDPAFDAGSIAVGELPLCHVRLQTDARWPWLILIPRLPGLREIEDLSPADRARLIEESVLAGQAVRAMGEALGRPVEKLNLGALGNVTAQLHVHLVGRRAGDPAWPGPVWGVGVAEAYEAARLESAIAAASEALNL